MLSLTEQLEKRKGKLDVLPWKGYINAMQLSYTYWEAPEGGYIGFLNQYPDY